MRAPSEVVAPMSAVRLLAGLAFAALTGCVHQPAPPAPPSAAPVPSAPGASAAPPGPGAGVSATPGAATPTAAAPSAPARSTAGTAAHPPPPKRPPSAAAPAAPTPGAGPAGASAARSAPPPLDLAALEQRLRDTHAIGVFTKLSLKNQVDDLLGQFRAFYAGQEALTLAELRRSYELLLLKVVTVLQDGDPALASAVSSSREALWAILSDRNRFNNL